MGRFERLNDVRVAISVMIIYLNRQFQNVRVALVFFFEKFRDSAGTSNLYLVFISHRGSLGTDVVNALVTSGESFGITVIFTYNEV